MEVRIITLSEIRIAGQRIRNSLSRQETGKLWAGFMPRRKEISDTIGKDLYSVEIYPVGFFDRLDPDREFEKWAGVPVENSDSLPPGMESILISAGLYAVILHRGPVSRSMETFQYLFGEWLPASDYLLDERPHFEIMDERYRGEDPDSREDFYVPIKQK